MSLLSLFSGLLDQHGDTAQQAALLAYLKQGEEAQPYLEAVLAARLAGTVYRTLSKEDQYEAARNETILSIAKWVKEHPRATQVSVRDNLGSHLVTRPHLPESDTGGGQQADPALQTKNRTNIAGS